MSGERVNEALSVSPRLSRDEVLVELYPVRAPFAYAAVVRVRRLGRLEYRVLEPPLTREDSEAIGEIKELLMESSHVSLERLRRLGIRFSIILRGTCWVTVGLTF